MLWSPDVMFVWYSWSILILFCLFQINVQFLFPLNISVLYPKIRAKKREHALFFFSLISRYKTDIFQRKKKVHIDLKKKNKIRIDQKYHTNIMSGDQSISQQKFSVLLKKICCEQSKYYLVCDSYPRTGCLDFTMG